MIVYELKNGGYRVGLFATPEGAMEVAQAKLDEYTAMQADYSEEDRESTEPLTTEQLEWSLMLLDPHGRVTDDPRWGFEYLTAFYSETGHFTIDKIEVGP